MAILTQEEKVSCKTIKQTYDWLFRASGQRGEYNGLINGTIASYKRMPMAELQPEHLRHLITNFPFAILQNK